MGLDKKTIAMAKEPNYATLTTLFKSGAPQTHVMWVDTDGENILINTEIHRRKYLNVKKWVFTPYLYRGVATAMHDQIRVHPDKPACINPKSERLIGGRLRCCVTPFLRDLVGPFVVYHGHLSCHITRSGNNPASPSLEASQMPRSVISPVIRRPGVTSKAGLLMSEKGGVTPIVAILRSCPRPWTLVTSSTGLSSMGISDTPS